MGAVWSTYIAAVYFLPLPRFIVISLFSWEKPLHPAGRKQTSPALWSGLSLHPGDINRGKPQVPDSHPNLCLGSLWGFALTLFPDGAHWGSNNFHRCSNAHLYGKTKSPKALANSPSTNVHLFLGAAIVIAAPRGKVLNFHMLNLSDMWDQIFCDPSSSRSDSNYKCWGGP